MARPHSVDCPAKINLYLDVLGRRPDGYHDLVTVMAPVTLCDTISVEPARRRDVLEVDPAGAAPVGPDNIVLRALRSLRAVRRVPPLRIRLTKRIPSQAGLGGGSSDAAGLLRAADRRLSLGLTLAEMENILASVGSDTAFFARGTPALCTGRGERVYPLARAPSLELVLAWPGTPNPTGEIFRKFKHSLTPDPSKVIDFLQVLAEGNPLRIARSLVNRLEPAAFAWDPGLRRVPAALRSRGLSGARMTGSGSAFYAVAATRAEADRAARRLEGRVFRVRTIAPVGRA
ncbi:MAG TPA: 4-(cytidine 5'-diphospho)-2-C-methyl-D-erythritol kinase [Planctomycetota bacterium]|nr:4-(cytidine 5'-diphospho)-2-C-methyl-D-erythritol kinase [Planctomycetota bacterium]